MLTGILLLIVVYAVGFAISTFMFGVSLFVVEGEEESSFRVDGQLATWGKAAALVVGSSLLGFLPFGGLLAAAAFVVGVMLLFQKTFVQTVVLLFVNAIIWMGISWGHLLGGCTTDPGLTERPRSAKAHRYFATVDASI